VDLGLHPEADKSSELSGAAVCCVGQVQVEAIQIESVFRQNVEEGVL
jgi:hypothetical protein